MSTLEPIPSHLEEDHVRPDIPEIRAFPPPLDAATATPDTDDDTESVQPELHPDMPGAAVSWFTAATNYLSAGMNSMVSFFRTPPKGPFRRIVVVGGGYGGQAFATEFEQKAVSKSNLNVEIVLIERRDKFFHCIAAVRALTEPGFSEQLWLPFDKLFRSTRGSLMTGTEVVEIHPSYLMARPTDPDLALTARPISVPFDYLVLATGLPNRIPARFPPSFVASFQAIELVNAIYDKINSDDVKTILIVGGGGVGVECAGELKSFYGDSKRVVLVERMGTLFPGKGITTELRNRVQERLDYLGVEVRLGWEVIEDRSRMEQGSDMTEDEYHELGVEIGKGSGKIWFEKHGFVGGKPRTVKVRRPDWWLEAKGLPTVRPADANLVKRDSEIDGIDTGDEHGGLDKISEGNEGNGDQQPREPDEVVGEATETETYDDESPVTPPQSAQDDELLEDEIESQMQFIFTGNLPPTVPLLRFPKYHDKNTDESPAAGPTEMPALSAATAVDPLLLASVDGMANGASHETMSSRIPHEPHDSPFLDPVSFELRVNKRLQLTTPASKAFPTPHIFAVGDVCGVAAPKLAWTAKSQARVVAANIVKLIREEGRFGIAGSVPHLSHEEEENEDSDGSNAGSSRAGTDDEDARNPSSPTFLPRRLEFLASMSGDLDTYTDYEGTSDPVGLIVMLGRNGGVAQIPVLGVLGDSFVRMTKATDGGLGFQRKEMGLA